MEARFSNRQDVFIYGHNIGLKNHIKVFCRVIKRYSIGRPRLIILTGRFILFGLNCRYTISLGYTDNIFDVIHAKTSLIQDKIVEKSDEARRKR